MRRDTPTPKTSLRREIKQSLSLLSPVDFHVQGAGAAVLLRESPLWASYGAVFLFLSLPNEIDTRPLVETALEAGKRVFAPRIGQTDTGELKFYRVVPMDPVPGLVPGPFGIREPPPREPPGPADVPALIVVPGLAFDRQGRRLGRGGGYYDRFLAGPEGACPGNRIIGLCMPSQLVREVPVEPWDRRMDGVCTGE